MQAKRKTIKASSTINEMIAIHKFVESAIMSDAAVVDSGCNVEEVEGVERSGGRNVEEVDRWYNVEEVDGVEVRVEREVEGAGVEISRGRNVEVDAVVVAIVENLGSEALELDFGDGVVRFCLSISSSSFSQSSQKSETTASVFSKRFLQSSITSAKSNSSWIDERVLFEFILQLKKKPESDGSTKLINKST